MPVVAGPFLGAGATFSFTPQGGVATPISYITNISIPTFEGEDLKTGTMATAKDANGSFWMPFIQGWLDAGVLEFEGLYDDATYSSLFGIRGKPGTGTVTLANGSTYVFPGYIKSLKAENPLEEVATMSFAFKVTGAPTLT